VLGVGVGLVAGYRGGWVDSFLMRTVDVLYGLPEILMIILLQFALRDRVPNVVVLFLAIGLVSWLTMARVVRGQVLSLRGLPFIEAARAAGLPESRIFLRHIFPNLAGPIIVYATLTVPRAILEESMLSFLGIGIAPPLATWGSLASDALQPALSPVNPGWWLLVFPCTLLAVTLLSLNFLGDGLRDLFDPKQTASNV
jgi:ABC-type dipeptide/oligopeptide/nickel transport system permease subunit